MVREEWIDSWKGLLIGLVVAGHVFGGACHLAGNTTQAAMEFLYKVIYMFHMPAFFWIAGRCWKTKDIGFGAFAANKARRLLVPYVCFGVLSVLAYLVMMNGGALFASATTGYYQGKGAGDLWQPFVSLLHAGGWPNSEGFRCNSVLWFLPAMFSVTCFYWLVDRMMPKRGTQLVLAGILLSFEFVRRRWFGMSLPMGISYIPWYGSFLIFGRWLRFTDLQLPGWGVTTGWFLFGLLTWLEPNYYAGHLRFVWYVVFAGMAIVGVALSAWTAKLISSPWIASLGLSSLGVMLVHKFLVLFLQVKLPFVAQLGRTFPIGFWIANGWVLVITVALSWWVTIVIRKIAPWSLGEFRK